MIFRMYVPKESRLRRYIHCFWYIFQTRDDVLSVDPKMIPDGRYHLIINLGSPHRFVDKEDNRFSPKMSHLNANQTDYLKIHRTGAVEIIGVIFKPFGLYPLLKCPIHEVSGVIWNVEDLLGDPIHDLEEQLSNLSTLDQKISKLEAWLLQGMNVHSSVEYEKIVQYTVDLIMRNKGVVKINHILENINLSERSLERHFKYFTGLTPKKFAGICRIQHVLREMRLTDIDMASYAIQGGFYDQSHFHHMFKRLTGTTPLSYMRSRDHLSDLYKTASK
ncbi:helix-turn-helix domain-containing protein [Paenibacillus lautus]|uniref:helix-turn-helix domain-containing protein n=1 Tax=Paenibacillus lautus TaxID=1401 RepID=UPI003D2CEF55